MVSIVLATYNGENFIKQQINSILAQDYQDFELIIQDDCSTDNTVSILNSYSKLDPRIKILKNERNLGYTKNFMTLLENVKGDFVFLSDQDDIWVKNKISASLEIFKKHKDAELLICSDEDFFYEEQILPKKENINYHYVYLPEILWSCSYKGCNMCLSANLVNNLLTEASKIDYIIAHDWFILCYAYCTSRILYTDKILLNYRIHDNNTSRKELLGNSKIQSRVAIINKQKKHIEWICKSMSSLFSVQDIKIIKDYLKLMDKRQKILANKKKFSAVRYIPELIKWNKYKKISKRIYGDIYMLFFEKNYRKCNNSNKQVEKK